MSDTDSDAESVSDSSNAHDAAGGDEALISIAVRRICNQLRANDPRLLDDSWFDLSYLAGFFEAASIKVFQALKKNTNVKHVRLGLHYYTKSSAEAAAEYVESSKTLQTLELWVKPEGSQENYVRTSSLL
jgi:hypothetical protein